MSLDAGGGGRMSLDEATSTRPSGEDGEGKSSSAGGGGGGGGLDGAETTSAPRLPPPPLRVSVPAPAPASVPAPGLRSAPLADDVGSFGNGVDGSGRPAKDGMAGRRRRAAYHRAGERLDHGGRVGSEPGGGKGGHALSALQSSGPGLIAALE